MQPVSQQECQRALERAMRALAARAHTEKELVDKLSRAGYSQEAIAFVMEKLTQYALVDDGAFAEGWVRARAKRGMGPYRLMQELRRKGVAREEAEQAVSSLDEEDTLAAAAAFAAKRLGQGDPDDRRRTLQALVRRGFGYDMARAAIDRALRERTDAPDSP